MTIIRVAILDDHLLVRRGIRSLLSDQPNIEIVGEGGSREELEKLVKDQNPDVVLLDLHMPQEIGGTTRLGDTTSQHFDMIRWVVRTSPQVRVLVISQYLDPTTVEGVGNLGDHEGGVRGYLLKDDALTEYLADAVWTVYRGGVYFSSAVLNMLRQAASKSANLSRQINLTPRQIQLLRLISSHPERSYAEHAQHLNISKRTLQNHLSRPGGIFERLDVNNITAAVSLAIRMGLVDEASTDFPG